MLNLFFLNKESLLSLYNVYIQRYINYANLGWASTLRTNLKKIHSYQKHSIRIIFCKDKFSHTKELFVQNKVFNAYQLNISNNLIFMHKVRTSSISTKFQKPVHPYPTNFSKLIYIKQAPQLNRSKYSISERSSTLEWVFNRQWQGNRKFIAF